MLIELAPALQQSDHTHATRFWDVRDLIMCHIKCWWRWRYNKRLSQWMIPRGNAANILDFVPLLVHPKRITCATPYLAPGIGVSFVSSPSDWCYVDVIVIFCVTQQNTCDVMAWERCPHYWPFGMGIHLCVSINSWIMKPWNISFWQNIASPLPLFHVWYPPIKT